MQTGASGDIPEHWRKPLRSIVQSVAYMLEPLVAGETRRRDCFRCRTHPPLVSNVEFLLDSPTEEDLVESFPVFLVSDELGAALSAAGLVGFHLDDANTVLDAERIHLSLATSNSCLTRPPRRTWSSRSQCSW
jgi:hypothetical protein